MAFWSTMAVEPKRQHRWYVTFTANNPILKDLQFAAKKVSKPTAKIGSITHKYLNHFFNYPGRLEWQDVSLTFASVSQPDATLLIDVLLSRAGYLVPQSPEAQATSFEKYSTVGKSKFRDVIGTVNIIQVDANGNNIEEWKLNNPFFTDVKFGSLDYGNEEIVDIECTIKYDWANLTTNPR